MTTKNYHSEITKIRRELSAYRPDSFLKHVVEHLHWSQTQNPPIIGMPWTCLFLLKLAMQESSGNGRDMAKAEFGILANKLHKIQHLACPIADGNIQLMLRPMILQQAWYQGEVVSDVKTMTRQIIWYSDEDSPYNKKFFETYGLSLRNFYLISLYLDITIADKAQGIIGINLYQLIFNLTPTISLKDIIRYFLVIAVRSQDLPAFFNEHWVRSEDKQHQQSEYFQTTPLRTKPVLLDGDNLFIYNTKLFSRGVSTLIPELLKKISNWNFKDHFGPAMEKYIGSLLAASSIEHLSEKDLKKCCQKNNIPRGKMADFLIQGSINIILESKAIEPGDIVSSVFNPEILRSHLQKNFIKGIEQCQESIKRLRLTKEYAQAEFACVVVTHEDFWFASADDITKYVDPELEARVLNDHGCIPLPFTNILFITIDAVESIFEAVSKKQTDLGSFLQDCIETLATPEGKRFTMSHLIQDKLAQKMSGHSIIQQKADEWHDYFQSILDTNKSAWQGQSAELIQQRMVVLEVLHRQFNRLNAI